MPLDTAAQAKIVAKTFVAVNALCQSLAWACGGGSLHLLAAVAIGIQHVVLLHASGKPGHGQPRASIHASMTVPANRQQATLSATSAPRRSSISPVR